jgi:hypothetical protein
LERKLARVDQKRSQRAGAADVAHLLSALQSPDEDTRAQAVRQVCPCRRPWANFDRLRKAAQRLQHDPSPLVRAKALHVAEDAREIAALEALQARLAERDEGRDDAAALWPRRGKRRPAHRR